MRKRQDVLVLALGLLIGTAAQSNAQEQPQTTIGSEIAGVQSSVYECPRLFVTVTWTVREKGGTPETTLSYGFAECASSVGFIGGGIIPNADFTVTRTSAHLLTTTFDGVIDVSWVLDGESRFSTDATTMYTARHRDSVKTVHHSESVSAVASGSIAGRSFSGRTGYVATVIDTSASRR